MERPAAQQRRVSRLRRHATERRRRGREEALDVVCVARRDVIHVRPEVDEAIGADLQQQPLGRSFILDRMDHDASPLGEADGLFEGRAAGREERAHPPEREEALRRVIAPLQRLDGERDDIDGDVTRGPRPAGLELLAVLADFGAQLLDPREHELEVRRERLGDHRCARLAARPAHVDERDLDRDLCVAQLRVEGLERRRDRRAVIDDERELQVRCARFDGGREERGGEGGREDDRARATTTKHRR
ncbi:hypothetical protein L6R52_03755 [Myxococcota bacterium]|nr:hypothetical protein [Myxococcota bacterium]